MVVRQHPRFRACFSGALIHQRQRHAISKSLDLSRKGCRVQSPISVFAGMKVDLLLHLPDSKEPVIIHGAIVRWSGSQGIGIEFPSLSSPYRERLEGTIKRLEATATHGRQQAPVSGRA
jgi:hypothetical protein